MRDDFFVIIFLDVNNFLWHSLTAREVSQLEIILTWQCDFILKVLCFCFLQILSFLIYYFLLFFSTYLCYKCYDVRYCMIFCFFVSFTSFLFVIMCVAVTLWRCGVWRKEKWFVFLNCPLRGILYVMLYLVTIFYIEIFKMERCLR